MNFGFVPFSGISDEVRGLLDRAVVRGEHDWGEVEQALESKTAQLWLTVSDRPVAAMVTRLDGKTLEVWLAGGAVLSGSVPFLEIAIEASREAGATDGRIWGRRGWDRVLKPYGWQRDGDFLVKKWG